MLIACWSAKGGAGTTVVAVSLALSLASQEPTGAVLADLAGDAPAVLGLPEPSTAGLAGWLRAGDAVPADALTRLEIEAGPGLGLLPRGAGPLSAERSTVLAALLERSNRPVVVDCGTLAKTPDPSAASTVAQSANRSLLVIRPCYLSVRKASDAPIRPTGAVVVTQDGHPLGRRDVERALGVPVVGQVPEDPAIAHAVDAGLVSGRLPRTLARGLRNAT